MFVQKDFAFTKFEMSMVTPPLKFYQNMCPVYAWANPIYGTSGNNPGEITPVGVTSSTEVSLRQFAFNDGLGTFSLVFRH